MADTAGKGWAVLARVKSPPSPEEAFAYVVQCATEAQAKSLVQAEYGGDPLEMVAAELTPNAIGFLSLEPGEVRRWE
jgi:hypothetical protein